MAAQTFKLGDNVSAVADIRSVAGEWPWTVPAGTPGWVKGFVSSTPEVHFNNGIIRLCKANEVTKP